MREITIIKKNGEKQVFNPERLEKSLKRSGASDEITSRIVSSISAEITDGTTTDYIYKKAYEMLESEPKQGQARYRYSLRRAVSELGPTGFAFEKFVRDVLAARGYTTASGIKISGKCVTHEVDVVAENESEKITAELKFHNRINIKTDLKVALYVNARFLDIAGTDYYGDKTPRPYLITNTKFTSNAKRYAECEGTLDLLGWDYPKTGENLHDVIQRSKIHPVTALTSFSKREHSILLDNGFIVCRDIKRNGGADVYNLGLIKRKNIERALEEIELICLQ